MVLGNARGPSTLRSTATEDGRAVFGGPPKTLSVRFTRTERCETEWIDEVFGGPPNTAGRRPALPKSTASFRLNHNPKMDYD